MYEKLKKSLLATENFVETHRGKICFVVGAGLALALNRSAVKGWNEFLEQKGLTEEFYHMDEDEEVEV